MRWLFYRNGAAMMISPLEVARTNPLGFVGYLVPHCYLSGSAKHC
jgi:hypothetical protein